MKGKGANKQRKKVVVSNPGIPIVNDLDVPSSFESILGVSDFHMTPAKIKYIGEEKDFMDNQVRRWRIDYDEKFEDIYKRYKRSWRSQHGGYARNRYGYQDFLSALGKKTFKKVKGHFKGYERVYVTADPTKFETFITAELKD